MVQAVLSARVLRFTSLAIIAQLRLQNKAGAMIDLLTFFEASCTQAHASKAHLFSLNGRNVTGARHDQHSAHGSGWQ